MCVSVRKKRKKNKSWTHYKERKRQKGKKRKKEKKEEDLTKQSYGILESTESEKKKVENTF